MLKNHERKTAHPRVMPGIAELGSGAGIVHRVKCGGQEVDNRFSGQTPERSHPYNIAKRKNSDAPTSSLRGFFRNRELLT